MESLKIGEIKDCVEYLAGISLMDGIPIEACRQFAVKSKIIKLSKKKIIYYQDDPNEKLYIILEGQIKISKFTADGKEITFEILGENDMFGYVSIMEDSCCECTITTLTNVKALSIGRYELTDIIENYPAVLKNLLKNACHRLRNTYQHIENMASSNVQKRVARILLELARQEGEYRKDTLVFNSRLTHQELANLAGTSRETVTRVLTYLKKGGYINVARAEVSILKEDEMDDLF